MLITDFIIELLVRHNVHRVYGYPGAAILGLIHAIYENKNIEWILMRNENAAALAASAEAKLTGHIAVCMSSSGPGVTNMITGLLDAHIDQAPVLAITGMIPTTKQNIYGFQDISNADFFKHFLSFSEECKNINMFSSLLSMALINVERNLCCSHLAIPADIALEPCPTVLEKNFDKFIYKRKSLMPPPKESIEIAKQYIEKHENIVIVVGQRATGAGSAIEKLAQKLGAPILATPNAKGIIRDNHPCFLGACGIYGGLGQNYFYQIIETASLVISFGVSNINVFVLDKLGYQKRSLLLCDPNNFHAKAHLSDIKGLYGPLSDIAHNLCDAISKRPSRYKQKRKSLREQEKSTYKKEKRFVHPKAILRQLSQYLKPTDIITTDIGDNHLWVLQELKLNAHQKVLGSEGVGAMGFGLAAAIAAKLACPKRRVIAIMGDGDISMLLSELGTAVQYKLNIIIIIFNNGVLQRVSAQEKTPEGVILHNPEFAKIAKDFGGDGITIHKEEEIENALQLAFNTQDKFFIINAKISPNLFSKIESFIA